MRREEIIDSDDYVRRLVEAAVALRDNAFQPPEWMGSDFVVVPPNSEVRQEAFAVTG